MLRTRSSTLLPVTSRSHLTRERSYNPRRRGNSTVYNPWGIALLLFLLGLAGTGAAWWHFRDAPAPARAKPVRLASHEAFLSKHSNAHLLEERFEREVQRRRNGGDGALGAQGQADASLGLGAHHAEAAGAGEGHAAVAAGHDDAAHAAASHLDAVHADAHAAAPPSLYDTSIHVRDASGQEVSMAAYRGKVLLVVNVASQCGYTKTNYEALQSLYMRYAGYGLEILAFPCNQFGGQEPGSLAEIAAWAATTYHVTFPLMDKVDVNGPGETPLFAWLKAHTPGGPPADVDWNFNKFLVDKWGVPRKRYASAVDYPLLEMDVYSELVRTA
uniref:Glutathione peroxidase n=1 Tax=Auxenochlorella protothecoides TaxID=3075 RepID=A0A1D2A7G7_AUXPR